jgi:hypothetical protein
MLGGNVIGFSERGVASHDHNPALQEVGIFSPFARDASV